jgi:hypothetical protein
MQRALHPRLAKRIQATDSSGQLVVADMSARELIDRAAAGTGTPDPARRHRMGRLPAPDPHPRATPERKASHVEVQLAGHRFLERTPSNHRLSH